MNSRLRVARVAAALAATICAAGMLAGTAPGAATVPASPGQASALSRGQHGAPTRSVSAWLSRRAGATNGGQPRASLRARSAPAAPSVPVGTNPFGVLVVPETHTVYVANIGGNTLSVINAATCNARVSTGCSETPQSITVGYGPLGEVFDPATQTLYVANLGSNTVSVINAATCNAAVSTGCDQVPKTVAVGSGPTVLALDRATHTLYVANGNVNTLSIINAATCNAVISTSCAATPPTVTVGLGPSGMAIEQSTDTVYTANFNDQTASVVNGATCNATDTAGCGQTTTTIPLAGPTDGVVIDQPSHTVYISYATASLGGVAMINAATCTGTVTRGCPRTAPPTAPAGSAPSWIAEDPATRTVYVANEEDSNVSILDAATCNIDNRSGCVTPPPAIAAGFNGGGIDIDVATDTIYYASQADNTLTILNGATCNAADTRGCTHYAPTTTVGTGPAGIAADPSTATVYVANSEDNDVSVINSAVCNAHATSGCGRSWPTMAGVEPWAVAVDEVTDTIYTANTDFTNTDTGTTVSVFDGASCNAHVSSGCNQIPATVTVGTGPVALAVDQRTNTIYVANGMDDTVSVIDGNTCDSLTTSGCSRPPATIKVGRGPAGIAIDSSTHTVYVSNGADNTVSVINGATCNATVRTGCGQQPATIAVGNHPNGLDVDADNGTVYVANDADNTVSLINDNTCNGRISIGCGQLPPTLPTGQLPFGVTVDNATDSVYVDSIGNSDVDVYNGDTCNATTTTGCARPRASIATGGWPNPVAIDPGSHTVYVPDNVDGQVSYFSTQ